MICFQVWYIYNLIIGSSLNSLQLDLNCKYGRVLSTHEDIIYNHYWDLMKSAGSNVWGSHYHYCWRWWFQMLWVTHTRLWPHAFLLCLFWYGHNWHWSQSAIVEFSCNLIRYVAVDGDSTCERDEFHFSHYTLFIILVFLVGISPLFLLQFAVWSLTVWLKSHYPFYQVNCHLLNSLTQSKCGEFLGLLSLSFPKRNWFTSSTKATISLRLASLTAVPNRCLWVDTLWKNIDWIVNEWKNDGWIIAKLLHLQCFDNTSELVW